MQALTNPAIRRRRRVPLLLAAMLAFLAVLLTLQPSASEAASASLSVRVGEDHRVTATGRVTGRVPHAAGRASRWRAQLQERSTASRRVGKRTRMVTVWRTRAVGRVTGSGATFRVVWQPPTTLTRAVVRTRIVAGGVTVATSRSRSLRVPSAAEPPAPTLVPPAPTLVPPAAPVPVPVTPAPSTPAAPGETAPELPGPADPDAVIDRTPPDTTITLGPSGSITSGIAVFGFASTEVSSTFECRLDAAPWEACSSPASYANLPLGARAFAVRAIDPQGNVDPTPATQSWTVLPAGPVTETIDPPVGDVPFGPVAVRFASTTEDATFQCSLDGGPFEVCTSPYTIVAPDPGAHVLRIRATSPTAGDESAPIEVRWTTLPRDETPPDTTIDDGPAGRVDLGPLSFDLGTSEPGSTFECRLDDGPYEACSSPHLVADPQPGPHMLYVRAIDAAGNVDPVPATRTWSSVAPRVDLCGAMTQDMALSPDYARAYVVMCSVWIPEGVTMSAEAGAVVKVSSQSPLVVDGSLRAEGTADSPVVFTSVADDSVGGDTNGDGAASAPSAGDWPGIDVRPGAVLELDRAEVRFAGSGVAAVRGEKVSRFVVQRSLVRDSDYGGIEVGDNRSGHDDGSAVIEVSDSQVLRSRSIGIMVRTGGWGTGTTATAVPEIRDNTISDSRSTAVYVLGEQLDPSKLRGNGGTGNADQRMLLTGTVQSDLSLPLGGLPLGIMRGLWIPEGVTMSAEAGAVVKVSSQSPLVVDGSLRAEGTADSPVVFTSVADDSVGGDTNGDGAASAPSAGDWPGIVVNGDADLEGTVLRYASTALRVNSDGSAKIRGKVLDSTVGVASSVFVDASDVDWGDSSGPAPYGRGPKVEGGGVLVNPWAGYEPPSATALPAQPSTPVEESDTPTCVRFVGVRGPGEAPQGGPYSSTAEGTVEDMGSTVRQVFDAYKAQLDRRGFDVGDSALMRTSLRYPATAAADALNYVPTDLQGGSVLADSYLRGAAELVSTLLRDSGSCGGRRRFVVVGYSQGALVVRLALDVLGSSRSFDMSHLLGVALVGDPARRGDGSEHHVGGADASLNGAYERAVHGAGIGLTWSVGSGSGWPSHMALVPGAFTGAPTVPSAIADRTWSLCQPGDIVCAPGRGATVGKHTNYVSDAAQMDHLESLGTTLADYVSAGG